MKKTINYIKWLFSKEERVDTIMTIVEGLAPFIVIGLFFLIFCVLPTIFHK